MIMKKRIGAITLAMVLCFSATACSDNSAAPTETESETEYFADEDFLSDLSKSLEARWDISEAQDLATLTNAEYKTTMESAIQAELDIVGKYQTEKFEDTKLQEYVLQYINNLKDQQASLDYIDADNVKFIDEWNNLYGSRTEIVSTFYNTYGLTVSEKYQSVLNDMLTKATIVANQNEQKAIIDSWVKSITFELAEDNSGWKTYQAVAENTTGYSFDYINLSINLIDSDGVILETRYSSFQNISTGAKVKFEFMSDAEFTSTEVTATYQIK